MKTLRLAPAFLLAALQIAALVTGPVKMLGQQRGRSFEQFAQFEMKLNGWRMQKYNRSTRRYETFQPGKAVWVLDVDSCNALPKEKVELDNPKSRVDDKPVDPTTVPREVSVYPIRFAVYEWTIKETGSKGPGSSKKLNVTNKFVDGTGTSTPCRTGLPVRKPGRYEISLRIYDKENRILTSITKIKVINRQLTIVSIGDSLASGEGNPDGNAVVARNWTENVLSTEKPCAHLTYRFLDKPINAERPASWLEPLAHRSQISGFTFASHGFDDGNTLVNFLNFATSGAKVRDGILREQHDWQGGGQLQELDEVIGNNRIDALVISIGANDVGFADGFEKLAKGGSVEEVINEATQKLQSLEIGLKAIQDMAVGLRLNIGKIYITEYPNSFFDKVNGDVEGGCDVFETDVALITPILIAPILIPTGVGINSTEAKKIKLFANKLNDTLREKARDLDWVYVGGISRDFEKRGYCNTRKEERYFVTAEESCLNQADFDGILHPNKEGHLAIARNVARAIRRDLPPLSIAPNPVQ